MDYAHSLFYNVTFCLQENFWDNENTISAQGKRRQASFDVIKLAT